MSLSGRNRRPVPGRVLLLLPLLLLAACSPQEPQLDLPPLEGVGGAELSIRLGLPGGGQPTAADLQVRDAIVAQLEERKVGEVVSSSAGEGYMEIKVWVADEETARREIAGIIARVTPASRMLPPP